MAAQTILNWLNTWAQGDNPGAGSQSEDSSGINGNFWKIAAKLNVIFSLPASILKNAIIGAPQLKTDVTDNATLTQDGSTNKLKIKDSGVGTTQVANDAITGAKQSHDNPARKWYQLLMLPDSAPTGYAIMGGVTISPAVATNNARLTIVRACSLTGISAFQYSVGVVSATFDYGDYALVAGDTFYVRLDENGWLYFYKNDVQFASLNLTTYEYIYATSITLEFENDD